MLLLQLCQIPSIPQMFFAPTVVGVLGDVESFSGFLRVDSEEDSQLFFWLVLKEKNPDTGWSTMSLAVFLFPTNGFMLSFIPQTSVILGPLVLWLQGGPGWPSMYGMFKENGPFLIRVHKEGENVKMFGMFFYMPRRKVIVVVWRYLSWQNVHSRLIQRAAESVQSLFPTPTHGIETPPFFT